MEREKLLSIILIKKIKLKERERGRNRTRPLYIRGKTKERKNFRVIEFGLTTIN